MMIRQGLAALLALGVLAGCDVSLPSVGLNNGLTEAELQEQRARDAALSGQPIEAPSDVDVATLDAAPVDGSAEATAAETTRILAATRPETSQPVVNSAGISSENDFDAVSGQRSIEDDAALIAANRAQREVVEPQALPDRVASGPNIVAYALSTTHAPGTQLYRRVTLNREARFRRACAAYPSADQAQIDFLARGGPERDRRGVDPDGDGFACNWDPRPFRLAAQGG
jgi:hypothetical protein